MFLPLGWEVEALSLADGEDNVDDSVCETVRSLVIRTKPKVQAYHGLDRPPPLELACSCPGEHCLVWE